jgi:hypothetical protein
MRTGDYYHTRGDIQNLCRIERVDELNRELYVRIRPRGLLCVWDQREFLMEHRKTSEAEILNRREWQKCAKIACDVRRKLAMGNQEESLHPRIGVGRWVF